MITRLIRTHFFAFYHNLLSLEQPLNKKNMNTKLHISLWLTLFLLLINVPLSFCQAGAIDINFNTMDAGFGQGDGPNATVKVCAIQADGKILIGGSFLRYNSKHSLFLTRINVDGTIDTSFNSGGFGPNNQVYSIAVQADGKILISGIFSAYNGTIRNKLARLNTNGTLDTSFDPGSGTNNTPYTITTQSDNKILIGGNFTTYNGTGRAGIARLNTDGSIDTYFNPGSGLNSLSRVNSIVVQGDGKILIGGTFTSYNGTSMKYFARLSSTGILDNNFNPGTACNNAVNSIAIQTDGKILIGGSFTSYNGITRNRIACINSDGSLYTLFDSSIGADLTVNSIKIQSDSKIVIGGSFTTYNGIASNKVARLNTDGTLDNSFNSDVSYKPDLNSMALEANDKIIIVGFLLTSRLNTDGSKDNSFNTQTGASYWVTSIAVQADDKIVVAGDIGSYNGSKVNKIFRLHEDGSLDTTFKIGLGPNASIHSIAIQSDQKILIGGNFSSFNGNNLGKLARLNPDGSLDNNFNSSIGADGTIYSIYIQPNDKILIGGTFSSYDGNPSKNLARINNNGSFDNSFIIGSGLAGMVRTIKMQSNNKVLIAGTFNSFNGITRNKIARLETNGNLDITFDPGLGPNDTVVCLAVNNYGKILIGGRFYSYNGNTMNCIAQLDSTGNIDNTFNIGTGANGSVNAITLQSDGKIIIGGMFSNYNGNTQKCISRLNANGAIDNSFNSGTGFQDNESSSVFSLAVQADGKILAGGSFTSYNGTGRNRIARIIGDVTTSMNKITSKTQHLNIYPNPSNGIFALSGEKASEKTIMVFDKSGKMILNFTSNNHLNYIDLSNYEAGIYLIRVIHDETTETFKAVVK